MGNSNLITVSQCRELRVMINQLTQVCLMTEDEYREFCILIYKVLSRIEEEENDMRAE